MKTTRILSIVLAFVMILGMLPVSAFATDGADSTANDLVVQITHVSLNPAKDALGFKAKVEGDVASVTEIGFAFRVNGGAEKVYTLTKTPEDGIFSARVQNILAVNGGEMTLEAYAFVRTADATVSSQWQATSMKQALQAVDAAWYTAGYTQEQKAAVKALCNQYKAQVEPWVLDNIFGGFFGNAGKFTSSSAIDLSTDCGEAPYLVLDAHKSTPLYTYIKGLETQNFSFEATVQVSSIIENEYYPKFGMLVNGQTEMVKFYLDMNTALQVSQVGAVHQNTGKNDDWAYQSINTLSETLDMSADTVTLKLVRDGVRYYFYVNGTMVLAGSDLTDEIGAAGFFSFGTELTLTDYTVEAYNAVYQDILTQAQADAEAFNQVRNQILQESTGYTVETLELGAKVWNGRGFVFTELPEELVGQSYVFGKISTQIDMTVLQNGYIYVLTPPTTHGSFPDNILAEGSGFSQVNIATDWCLANYSNPIDTLVFERQVKPGEIISIDASWAIVVVSKERVNLYDLLLPNDGNTLETVAIGQKIWSDEDMAYTFISMPEQLLGKQYIYGSIHAGVDVTIGCNGYIYVVTPPRTNSHFAKDVDTYGFKRLELPQWTFADYNTKLHTWVYELKVSSGEQIQLDPWWGVLIGSETQLDLAGNGVTVADDALAEITAEGYDSLPVELKQQVFSDQASYYYHTIPYWLAGKSYLRAPLNGGSATVTKAGKLYLLGRNETNGQKYLDVGFTHVMDLDFEPWGGTGLGGGNFAAMGFALYEKDVTVGETVTWGRWGVPIFYSGKQLPAEPVAGISGIEITKMPTKTTYKLGESFDETGLVVSGIDYYGNKVVLDREEYLVAPVVLSADVPAVSVIVNDKICAIPVTVTDENGNDLTDYTPADMSGFTTQRAPIVTGSISRGTVDEIVATIAKEEADGATGFIVYLTTLTESERTVENLKRIADCTEYPVMALAYGNYSNLEVRLNLWRMAVEAGFDAVDIPMDTYSISDDASKTSYAGTIFACAAPKEVSMDADVIAQQQAFMAELRAINPEVEILMSAHVGVALNQTQGVALAKEMEARGVDFAKIVLASTSDLEEALQTNMVLQEELSVPFFYNCAGAASRPFRTAAGLMGTQVVFCCAPYHEINAYVYDYARDLREFYNTIPELYLQINDEPAVQPEGVSLSENYFIQTEEGKYSLTTNGYTDAKVDTVAIEGEAVRAASYRVKGTLSLTNADTWGQARILTTADETNGYVIALEKVGESAYQIFTMSRLGESAWNDWRLISHYEVNGDRNAIDFELVVDSGKITFLLDDKICYENSRVAMEESTPGFGASNVATAIVSNLDAQVFADSAEAESYLATKSQAEYVSRFQTRMDSLYNEYMVGNNCAGKGGTLIFGDSYMDFWSNWESLTGLTKYVDGYNVGIGGSTTADWLHAYEQLVKPFAAERIIINIGFNDINVWGDDGEEFAENLKTLFETIHADYPDAEIYYIYINPCPYVYADGAYTNWKVEDAINRSKELVAGLDYVTGVDIFDLMTTEDDQNPVASYYVSDNIHLSTAGYEVFSDYLYELIFKPEYSGFFGETGDYRTGAQFDLSADTGANTGTVTVSEQGTSLGYANEFYEENFYFETKIHVNGIKSTESWPKFGLFVQDGTIRHHFYVDMTTALTATTVGRVTVTNGSYDWTNINTATVSTMAFSGEGETITMGVLKDGKYLHLFIDGKHVLSYESAMTGSAVAGVFGFNTGMTLTEYFADTAAETLAAKKALLTRYTVLMGDASVMSYDAASDTITIDMDSSSTRNLAQLYDHGIKVHGERFAVSGHMKVENTITSGSSASKVDFLISDGVSDFLKMTLYRYESDSFQNNSIYVTTYDSGNGNTSKGFVANNGDGTFTLQGAVPNDQPAGDPYEVDYQVIYENGTVYLVLDGQLAYRYEGTFTDMFYRFGVTMYADATYTNTQVIYDAYEVAKMAEPYRLESNNGFSLTTDHATVDSGIYTLNTDTAVAETVLKDGAALNETYYKVRGTIYNNGTSDWAQSHIVVKADDTHAVRFVLERTDKGYYQVFTEKNFEDENWADWTGIILPNNQSINRMNFDVAVIKDTIYLIIDNMVYYSAKYEGIFETSGITIGGQNVSMTVSNLSGEVFADAASAQAYVDAKPAYKYFSNFMSTINNRYDAYFGTNVITHTGGTLLIGSSSIDFWGVEKYCGQNSWTASQTGLIDHVTGYNVGIGGTCIEDWIYAYDKLIAPFAPSRVIVYVGANDVAGRGDTGANTAAELESLLEKIHADFPDAEIYYVHAMINPNNYSNGAFANGEYAQYVSLTKEFCQQTDWVTGIDMSEQLSADGQNANTELFFQDGHLNEAGYKVWNDCLYDNIFKNDPDRFFGKTGDYSTTVHVNLNQDTGANTGTTTVVENGIAFGYVDDFEEENFYFETKIHVNGIKSTESYPKFGLFVRSGNVRHNFYVDMKTDLTATVVGRMTNTDGSDNWSDVNKATVSTMAFSGEGEYITMGILKEGKYLHLFVDGKHVLSYESDFTGKAMAGVFSFNTGMTLTQYFVDTSEETLTAKKALLPRYTVLMGDASVMSYDAASDTITVDMDSSSTRNLAQLYDHGLKVHGECFAVSGHMKVENTKTSGSSASKVDFLISDGVSDYLKMTLYRYESDSFQNNSIYVTTYDSGNGNTSKDFVANNGDGTFTLQSAVPNDQPAGDPYEVDYQVIYENGTVYLVLDGQLAYRYEGTFTDMFYRFGVTMYADATYTNTQVTYDAEEIAAMTAAYTK